MYCIVPVCCSTYCTSLCIFLSNLRNNFNHFSWIKLALRESVGVCTTIMEEFLQIKGTAMGSTFAPNYANLFVGFFEYNVVFNHTRNPFVAKIIK